MIINDNFKHKSEQPILFFDSGVGGLPYLELAMRELPEESYIYVCDTLNFPYGTKDSKDLIELIINQIAKIIEGFSPKIGVIACNTASVIALSRLRERFKIPFIGVVPAVKPAVEKVNGKRIAVVATQRTIEDQYLKALIQDFASKNHVLTLAANELVTLVENDFFILSFEERIKKMNFIFQKIKNDLIDTVVLGCTHFILLQKEFYDVLGPNINIIDSREGVIRQLIKVLKMENLLSKKSNKITRQFWLTRAINQNKYRKFADFFNLDYNGEITSCAV